MLRFSKANAKIEALQSVPAIANFLTNKRKVFSMDLLSGFSCPYANECLSKAVVTGVGRFIQDGPNTLFRCFSATQELIFPAVYDLRKANFDLLKRTENKAELIEASMPHNLGVCRIHVGGDFFNYNYMLAWANVARNNPDKLFYAYTKSLPFWTRSKLFFNSIPNFILTASYGGRHDNLIKEYNLRSAKVVFSPKQAEELNLEIDHDDSHAANPANRKNDFGLLIHGVQPKGSQAAFALNLLKKNKIKHSYSKGG